MKAREACSRCFNRQPAGCWLCGGTGKEPTCVIAEVAQRDLRPGDRQMSTRGLLTVTEVDLVEVQTGMGERTAVHVYYNGERPPFTANLYPDTKVMVMRFVDERDAKRVAKFFIDASTNQGV